MMRAAVSRVFWLRVAITGTILALAATSEAAPITWDITVFNLTGTLAGNTYTGLVSVDDSFIASGYQRLNPANSDLSIVFDFLDEDGITPRRYTEADDPDYPSFPELTLLDGAPSSAFFFPAPGPGLVPSPPLNYVYVDSNGDRVWGFGSFSYTFLGGGSGEAMLTPSPVPEPATLLLLGMGLAGAGVITSRRKR
jgi:hypothetical protein